MKQTEEQTDRHTRPLLTLSAKDVASVISRRLRAFAGMCRPTCSLSRVHVNTCVCYRHRRRAGKSRVGSSEILLPRSLSGVYDSPSEIGGKNCICQCISECQVVSLSQYNLCILVSYHSDGKFQLSHAIGTVRVYRLSPTYPGKCRTTTETGLLCWTRDC